MTIEKKPFVPYKTEEERIKDNRRTFTISVNDEEWKLIRDLREWLKVDSPGKVLKISAVVGYNVLKNQFGPNLLKYLSSKDRKRLGEYLVRK